MIFWEELQREILYPVLENLPSKTIELTRAPLYSRSAKEAVWRRTLWLRVF